MKSYEEIKEEEFEFTKDYSDKKLNRYIKLCEFLIKYIMSELFFWIISLIPMALVWSVFILLGLFELDMLTVFLFTFGHLFYWYFYGKKDANKIIDESCPEFELRLRALEEIRKERNL